MTGSTLMSLVTALMSLWGFPLGQAYMFVDLSHVQNMTTLYWPGVPTFNRTIVAAGTSANGIWIEVGAFSSGEHGGTHIDVPRHFIENGMDLKDFPLERTVAEGVVIDCSAEAERNADYAVTKEKIEQWEEKHGRIPNEAAVLFRFGYAKKFWEPEKYLNTQQLDDATTYHFPSVSLEAVKWLVKSRNLKMIGMDVPSPDPPTDLTYPVHRLVLPLNIMIMENVNIVPSLPPRNFRLHAAPIRIENGTGVQTRIYAMLYERMNDGSPRLSSPLFVSFVVCLSLVSAVVKIISQ
ncbi:hypothetical protein RRG08_052428 [Elysia crispata]|uniref:Kynurenine formamidase n=1 Tax=Elysia crispata TaxID=231223 RepID=A0AAE1B103_9GAST|nr:hypothetical protein RRG08_052428 [Elysia crispata]